MVVFIFIRGIIRKESLSMAGGIAMEKFDDVSVFAIKTKEQILKELEISRKQVENGQYQDFDSALDEICEELGI